MIGIEVVCLAFTDHANHIFGSGRKVLESRLKQFHRWTALHKIFYLSNGAFGKMYGQGIMLRSISNFDLMVHSCDDCLNL